MSEKNDNQQISIEMKEQKNSNASAKIEKNNKTEVLLSDEETTRPKEVFLEMEKGKHKEASLATETKQNCKKHNVPNLKKEENKKLVPFEIEPKPLIAGGSSDEEKCEKPDEFISDASGRCCFIRPGFSGSSDRWYTTESPRDNQQIKCGPSQDTWRVWRYNEPENKSGSKWCIFGTEYPEQSGSYFFITRRSDTDTLVLEKNLSIEPTGRNDPRFLVYTTILGQQTIVKIINDTVKYVVPEGENLVLRENTQLYPWYIMPCI